MGDKVIGLEVVGFAKIREVTTDTVTANNWTQLGDVACKQVVIYNQSAVSLEVRYCNHDGTAISGEIPLQVEAGVAQPLRGIQNAKQVEIRLFEGADGDAETVTYMCEGV